MISYEVMIIDAPPVGTPGFAVVRIDTDKRVENGCEGIVQSLHHTKEQARTVAGILREGGGIS